MSPLEPPTVAELVRRIEEAVRQIGSLANDMREERRWIEQRFVPRGEYAERREAVDRRLDDVERDLEVQAGFRRQVQAALIVGFILLLVPVIGTVATFATRGGS